MPGDMTIGSKQARLGRTRGAVRLMAFLAVGPLSACNTLDDLLDVELSGQVEAGDAEVPAKAGALVDGAVTAFNCALTSHIELGGLLGDEFEAGSGFVEARTFAGYATAVETGECAGYLSVARARWVGDNALRLLEGWSDAEVAGRSALIARAAVYAGYAHLLLGERFCTMALDGGPEIQPAEVFQRAQARFTTALQAATSAGTAELLNLARLGRARARLDLGRMAEAATDAALVPRGFVYVARYPATSPGRNDNLVYPLTYVTNVMSVGTLYRDFRYAGTPDPRVAVRNAGRLTINGVPLWQPVNKHSSTTSAIELGTWAEAQLIVAEAALQAGDLATAVAVINALHTNAGLPAFSSTDAAEIRNQIIYERRAELFLEGQHIGDYRRLELPLVPPPGARLADGASVYGTFRCFPMPPSERNSNPNVP